MNNHFLGYRQVLFATDFSPYAESALKQAVWLARRCGASITLAHVLPDLRGAELYQSEMQILYGEVRSFEQDSQATYARMGQMIHDMNATDVDVKFEALMGEPFVEVTHAVQRGGHDLVMTGSRGLSAWEQFFVGSTANRLIRKCPAPVWIAKIEHVGAPKVVLVATDFSAVSFKAVMQAVWVAQQAGAELHLLHVIDSKDVPEDVISKIPQGSTLRNEINTNAKERLDKFVSSIGFESDAPHVHLSWGTPWKEIGRLAAHVRADLIVMGTVGRGGVKGVLLGNTAEKVLNSSECSILTIKPDDYRSPIQPDF
jgi:universal stress protein E